VPRLDELCGDDVSLRAEVLSHFVDETERAVARLDTALAAHDPEQVSREAHRLRGNCLTLGVERMACACWGLDALGRQRQFATAAALLAQVRAEFRRVGAEMAEFSGRRPAGPGPGAGP
jgi:HPt (histidine-containing phosphotransfer) domain-containing protein